MDGNICVSIMPNAGCLPFALKYAKEIVTNCKRINVDSIGFLLLRAIRAALRVYRNASRQRVDALWDVLPKLGEGGEGRGQAFLVSFCRIWVEIRISGFWCGVSFCILHCKRRPKVSTRRSARTATTIRY